MNHYAYDAWKLDNGYNDAEEIAVYKSSTFDYYSTDIDLITEFDNMIKKALHNVNIFTSIVDDDIEDIEQYADYLAQELGLWHNEYNAIS